MELGARTSLLLALAAGPGFGLELIARVATRTEGSLRLNRGGVYLALRSLERQGLVHGWTQGRSGSGRPRRYYELTPRGILLAEKIHRVLQGLTQPERRAVGADETRRMAERLERGGSLSVGALRLRAAGRRAGV